MRIEDSNAVIFRYSERLADTVLSLPMGPHLTEAQVELVIQAVRESLNE